MGALDMGLSPNLRPGRGFNAHKGGRDTLSQLEALRKGDHPIAVAHASAAKKES